MQNRKGSLLGVARKALERARKEEADLDAIWRDLAAGNESGALQKMREFFQSRRELESTDRGNDEINRETKDGADRKQPFKWLIFIVDNSEPSG
jgi:hypothetical protein